MMKTGRNISRNFGSSSTDICNMILNCSNIDDAQQLSTKIIPRSYRLMQVKKAINSGDLKEAKFWASKEILDKPKAEAAWRNYNEIKKLFNEYIKKNMPYGVSLYSEITLLKKMIDYSHNSDCKETRDEILAHAIDVYMAVYVHYDSEYCYYKTIVYSPTKGFQKSMRNAHCKIKDRKHFIPDANRSYQLVNSHSYANETRIISKASEELAKITGDPFARYNEVFCWK